MKEILNKKYDTLIKRCPSLGGEVPFLYCRQLNVGGPCHRLISCWSERFDIYGYIKEIYTKEEIEKYFMHSGQGRLNNILKELERIKMMKEEERMRSELIEIIKKEASGGKITCAKAWALADKYKCPRSEMGELLNQLKIKITTCQLGCF